MNLYEPILAAMLFLQPAGKSVHSRVVVDEDADRPCDQETSLLCRPPIYSTSREAWTVAETREQGLVRYSRIARAAAKVLDQKQWSTPRTTLYRLLLTSVYHESGFRRDVHEGVGPSSMGDCRYRTVERGGRTVKIRVPGSCRSVCLVQRLLPRGQRTAEGWTREQLVGLDEQSTRRCLTVGVRIIDQAYSWCATRGPKPLVSCVFRQYGGGRVAGNDPRIRARVATYAKLRSAPTKFSSEVRAMLNRQETTSASKLVQKTKPINP